MFYSHVNYSVTKINQLIYQVTYQFYSHVNYSVTKIIQGAEAWKIQFYSHVNYSVTKIRTDEEKVHGFVLQSRKLFSY